MKTYLEHANITVPDLDEAIDFLITIDPEFKVRHRGVSGSKCEWAHIGTDNSYIALQSPYPDAEKGRQQHFYRDTGINHLGWVVENLEAVEHRLQAKGYQPLASGQTSDYDEEFRRRTYYYDRAGIEWEIIEYLSDDPAKRNYYETA